MAEMEIEFEGSNEIPYKETFVSSFEEASNKIIEADQKDPDNCFRFLITDIDGVLIDNNFVKQLPFVSHLFVPSVTDSTETAFEEISQVFKDRMVIATNRDRNVRIFWNSDKVMARTDNLVTSVGQNIPVFEKMQKQLPFLAKGNASRLLEYICSSFVQSQDYERKERIVLNSIEDVSIVSPIRKTFLMYLSKKLYRELGIDIEISNYVIES